MKLQTKFTDSWKNKNKHPNLKKLILNAVQMYSNVFSYCFYL